MYRLRSVRVWKRKELTSIRKTWRWQQWALPFLREAFQFKVGVFIWGSLGGRRKVLALPKWRTSAWLSQAGALHPFSTGGTVGTPPRWVCSLRSQHAGPGERRVPGQRGSSEQRAVPSIGTATASPALPGLGLPGASVEWQKGLCGAYLGYLS